MNRHPACQEDEDLLAECDVRRQRRSGPGGQHRNKVETGVFLSHRPTGIASEATERRSQAANLGQALFRLRVNLAISARASRSKNKSSELWQRRCRGRRISVSPNHRDFPQLLAEALDTLADCDWDAKSAAEQLSCSMSQLVKLLKIEPRALQLANSRRQSSGLHPLR